MAWFDKDKPNAAEAGDQPRVDPANAATAGKSPADLIAESLSGFETRIKEQFDALGTRLSTVEQQTAKPAPHVEPGETPSVFEDENAAFNNRLGPIAMRQLELEARVVKGDIKAEYAAAGFSDLWKKFEKEIDGQLNASALVQPDGRGGVKALRGDPDYIRNVVDMILGRALRGNGIKFDGSKDKFFLEDAGGTANGNSTAADTEGFTPEQLRVLNRMGIPLADAKKTKAKLNFVN